MTSIALQHRDTILQRIANGDILRKIAEDLGVTKQAISLALVNDPDYQAAIEVRWQDQLDAELQAMRDATDAQDLDAVRAREAILRRVEWRAEREASGRWGQRSQVDHQGLAVHVVIGIERDMGRARVVGDSSTIPTGIVAEPQRNDPPAQSTIAQSAL